MSTYDDWIVNFKVDTAPLDKALEKVAKLRAEINGLHGLGGLGGGGGRGPGTGSGGSGGGNRQSSRMTEMYASQRYLQAAERRRERYERERERTLADFNRAYDRRAQIEQMRQLELATMGARERARAERERQRLYDRDEAAAHRYNRWRNGQASAATRNANRADNFGAAQRSRELQLSRLEDRMRASGAGNMGDLANIRQRLGAATNQTQLNQLAPDMRNFVIQTNQAINAQNRLQRQLDRNGFAVRAMSNSMANMARSYLSVYAVVGAAGSMYKPMKEMENLQVKLQMGMGGAAGAATTNDYIQRFSQKTGTSIQANTNMYAQLGITAKDAGLNDAQIKKVFEDTTTMAMGYGLSKEQQKFSTKSIIQMMSLAA